MSGECAQSLKEKKEARIAALLTGSGPKEAPGLHAHGNDGLGAAHSCRLPPSC